MKGPLDTPRFIWGEGGPTWHFSKARTSFTMLWMDTQHTKHMTYKLNKTAKVLRITPASGNGSIPIVSRNNYAVLFSLPRHSGVDERPSHRLQVSLNTRNG